MNGFLLKITSQNGFGMDPINLKKLQLMERLVLLKQSLWPNDLYCLDGKADHLQG